MSISLTDPLTLPCGAVLANRIAKPAITEGLADARGRPTDELERLYSGWADGGQGLIITGNIIVDRDHLERPGNVVIDHSLDHSEIRKFESWTASAKKNGAHIWAQLSHSGRQTPATVNPHPMSPSAVRVDLPGHLFGKPREMSEAEIFDVIERFANAARICRSAGFTGVQIHAAHGYLISSFLSQKTNTRQDCWGGSLINRSLLLLSIVFAVRDAVGPDFPISVKLNSADFQKTAFTASESIQVARSLEIAGVDLLEISGGSYENPVMMGDLSGAGTVVAPRKESTLAREAYFIDFARQLRQRLTMPIMLTGGLRTRQGMQEALDEGVDILGVARPVCVDLAAVKPLLDGTVDHLPAWEEKLRREKGFFSSNSPVPIIRTLNSFSGIYWFYAQLYRLGRGEVASERLWPPRAMMEVMKAEKKALAERTRAYRQAA